MNDFIELLCYAEYNLKLSKTEISVDCQMSNEWIVANFCLLNEVNLFVCLTNVKANFFFLANFFKDDEINVCKEQFLDFEFLAQCRLNYAIKLFTYAIRLLRRNVYKL